MPASIARLAPGAPAALELAQRHFADAARILDVGSGGAIAAFLRTCLDARVDAIDGLEDVTEGSYDGIVCLDGPARMGRLVDVLATFADALVPSGLAIVSDVVWATAPTPRLAQAFAPPPGRERVRPFEGYEMQADHAGFDVVERLDMGRDEWIAHFAARMPLDEESALRRDAIVEDERQAARSCVWLLRKA